MKSTRKDLEFAPSSIPSLEEDDSGSENLWKAPYQISKYHGNNSYSLQEINGDPSSVGPVNRRFLKHYLAS